MVNSVQDDLVFEWGGLSLAGTLHRPASDGSHPAVLMMQGSGPADRESDGYFPQIRNAFLEQGIAAFSFDKPGCGDSTGNWRDYALEDRADQAQAALRFLREHRLIDASRVGAWGHSQGGWLAQILASRLPDLAFAIANSGPSIGVIEQNLYGCEHEMRSQGHDEAGINQALAFIVQLHQAAQRKADYKEVEGQLLRRVRDEPWYGYASIDDAKDWAHGTMLVLENYEPLKALVQIRCPFLAIYGGCDVLVPAWRSAQESGNALRTAGNNESTVVVFPQGDHRIRDEMTLDFVPGYLDLLVDWTSHHSRSDKVAEAQQ